jgi:multidrug efflux pump subunit AcrA (membrane-fusion protein)
MQSTASNEPLVTPPAALVGTSENGSPGSAGELAPGSPASDPQFAAGGASQEAASPRARRLVMSVILPLLILSGGAGAMVLLIMLKEPPATTTFDDRPLLVSTAPVQPAAGSFQIRVHGTVVPKHEVTLAAEVAGRVIEKTEEFRAGNFVKAGTLLLRVDPQIYKLEVQRLENELKQVDVDLAQLDVEESNWKAMVEIASIELELAEMEFRRVEGLFKKGTVTEAERNEKLRDAKTAESNWKNLENSLKLVPTRRERLEAQRKLTQTRLDQVKLDLEKTRVEAPIAGVISEQMVEQNDFVQRGTVLGRIEDRSVAEVKCNLLVDDLYWLWAAQTDRSPGAGDADDRPHEIPHAQATITYTLGGERFEWAGFLSRYEGGGIDERTRTVPCRVEVPKPRRSDLDSGPPTLVRGMFVTVSLSVTPKDPSLLAVPETALQPRDYIWCLRNRALARFKVRVAKRIPDPDADPETSDGMVLVRALPDDNPEHTPLQPGDRVVISPLPSAHEGQAARENGLVRTVER